jgi:hypothetical protein
MSLVSTYVKADGKYYKNPVYRGKDWFICFDDDDPIEVVMENPGKLPMVLAIMKWSDTIEKHEKAPCGQRLINNHFQDCYAYFIYLKGNAVFPIPDEYDAIIDERSQLPECIVYGDV